MRTYSLKYTIDEYGFSVQLSPKNKVWKFSAKDNESAATIAQKHLDNVRSQEFTSDDDGKEHPYTQSNMEASLYRTVRICKLIKTFT